MVETAWQPGDQKDRTEGGKWAWPESRVPEKEAPLWVGFGWIRAIKVTRARWPVRVVKE